MLDKVLSLKTIMRRLNCVINPHFQITCRKCDFDISGKGFLSEGFFQEALLGCFFKERMSNKQERVLQLLYISGNIKDQGGAFLIPG